MHTTIPQGERRPLAERGPAVTTRHRQARQGDPDLVQLDRRIRALEDLGDTRDRRFAVGLLRRSWDHLDRDKVTRLSSWLNDARNLKWAVECEEAHHG